ncbi:MAG: class I SAM-dependent methyltransferase [Nanoarchaeota archaeon]|nr:class I SAM-dependent methyltransferase [Nanoarchaeota archaeon]
MEKKNPLDNKARAERMADIFPHKDYYESKLPMQRKFENLRIDLIKRLCGNTIGKKILDIGIGDGLMAEKLAIDNLWGIDISSKRCNRAKKRVPHATIIVENAEKMKFEDDFFDGVICADVLEHATNPDKIINEMIRVTKKDGFIVVSLPNEPVFILARTLLLRNPFNPDHTHWISKRYLLKRFKRKPTKILNIPNLIYPFCLSHCYKFIK